MAKLWKAPECCIQELNTTPRTPERHLLSALLERCIKDLSTEIPVDPQDRRDAIKWFRCKASEFTSPFSYQQVKEELELSARMILCIERYLHLAVEFEDRRVKALQPTLHKKTLQREEWKRAAAA